MRIKKCFMPCFFLVIAVLFFGLLAPASADFKKVNERELARTNASLTGQIGTIICPDPADLSQESDQTDCIVIPAKKDLVANEGSLAAVYTDYEYDWWKSPKVVGDLYYYEDTSVFSPTTAETGVDGDKTWARIGLGSQELELDSWDKDVIVDCCSKSGCSAYCEDQVLGSLYLDGLAVKTNGSSNVTLYMVNCQTGIGTDVDVTVDRIDLATFSWGDDNGFGATYTNAGFVGLKNTSIIGVTAYGSVAIDVKKEEGDVNSVHIRFDDMNVGMCDTKIGMKGMDIGIDTLDTAVVLGDKKDFSGTMYVLGTLYMKRLDMTINGDLKIFKPVNQKLATSFDLDLKVPTLTVETLSWGDPDGFEGARKAGYIGLSNLDIKGLTVGGLLTIRKDCPPGGADINHPVVVAGVVTVDFKNIKVKMAYMKTDIALGPAKDDLNQVLGVVALSRLSADINGSVQISAH